MSLLLGILGAVTFNHLADIRELRQRQAELACYSAAQQNASRFSVSYTAEYYATTIDSTRVSVAAINKGLFRYVMTAAKSGNDSVRISCLFASALLPEFENAIVFSKFDAQLMVAGMTRIRGDILMSVKQITKGSIFGIKNPEPDYHIGQTVSRSQIRDKFFRDTLLAQLFQFPDSRAYNKIYGDITLTAGQLDTIHDLWVSGSLTITGHSRDQANYEPVNIISRNKIIIRDSVYMNRELSMFCDSSVTVGSGARIENLLAVTRGRVLIGAATTCKFAQFFALGSITASNAYFSYPSILCSYVTGKQQDVIALESSVLNGSVLLICDVTGKSGNTSKIMVDGQSKVQGLVYSENLAELAGDIRGCAYTRSFRFYKDPTEYVDWMVNLTVDRTALDRQFLAPIGFGSSQKLKLLRQTWIR